MTVYTLKGIEVGIPDWLKDTRIEAKLASGDYENKESEAALKRIKKGWRVLEIGAGLGYVSSICAQTAGAENVMSVEANPKMLDPIRANLDRNGQKGVNLVHGAVVGDSHSSETVKFRAGALFWGGGLVEEGASPDDMVEVPALPIGHLLAIHQPQFVMMDIEGGEQFLFDEKWPKCVRHVVLELHQSKYPRKVIKKIVDCMSRSGLTYDPSTSSGRTLGFMRVGKVKKG
ncbi:FkbM family methyltransferase [Shimia isoporae]|uniref:FkbM family methyltransferase n=1 Tax=Shimia isoporae TaxID=647720 RepID=A0A4R1NM17_9RHOB|nr:FkbM family methyltransferase [Shimia isoporae]TCL08761.1 FkbM family methyltransferase [Shimia isoporae]